MTTKQVVAPDVALAEFERMADTLGIDIDEANMDDEDVKAFKDVRKRITRAIVEGHLTVNEDGEPTYTPHRPGSKYREPITFHERTGASLMAMDGKKKGHDVGKTYAVMADMTGLHAKTFAGLVGADIKTCEALFGFLMA